jgi:GNAT superfamily N-acetyltransferase
MPEVAIEQITQELTWALRRDALYPGEYKHNMSLPEDDQGTHYGAFYNNKLAGVVSLFKHDDDFQFRKFAVAPDLQGQGIGTQLLTYIIGEATSQRAARLWCNARTTATEFYTRAGLQPTGEPFTKGEHEYIIMEKLF